MKKILLTGGSGQIGKKLGPELVRLGYQVVCTTRNVEKNRIQMPYSKEFIEIDLTHEKIPKEKLLDIDVVIHLMGESVDGYWTESKKKQIYDSRVKSSKHLVDSIEALTKSQKKPVVISASALGIYGDCKNQLVTESDVPENANGDFLLQVCKDWEKPFVELAKTANLRAVQLRFPMILDPDFGAFKKLLGVFNKNIGAVFSDGNQWMSWASSQDIIEIILFVIQNQEAHGAINCAAPGALTNKQFTSVLSKKLNVFTLPAVPRFVLRTLFGEMSTLFLNSTRSSSEKLGRLGYKFKYSELQQYLDDVLKT